MKNDKFDKVHCELCMWYEMCNNERTPKKCIHFTELDNDGFVLQTIEEYLSLALEADAEYLRVTRETMGIEEDDE